MIKIIRRNLLPVLFLMVSATLLPSCMVKMGDMESVMDGRELAINCKIDEALKALDRAEQTGGIGALVADLEREVIFRDAGRISEADALMQKRNQRPGLDPKTAADSEQTVLKGVEDVRAERLKRSGKATCN